MRAQSAHLHIYTRKKFIFTKKCISKHLFFRSAHKACSYAYSQKIIFKTFFFQNKYIIHNIYIFTHARTLRARTLIFFFLNYFLYIFFECAYAQVSRYARTCTYTRAKKIFSQKTFFHQKLFNPETVW